MNDKTIKTFAQAEVMEKLREIRPEDTEMKFRALFFIS